MTKKISTLLLAGAFAAMPAVCFAADQAVDGPLPAGNPASVHEAQMEDITPAVIALTAGAIIITVVAINASTANGTH